MWMIDRTAKESRILKNRKNGASFLESNFYQLEVKFWIANYPFYA